MFFLCALVQQYTKGSIFSASQEKEVKCVQIEKKEGVIFLFAVNMNNYIEN
jgi:hypothetical protein